MPGPEAHLKPDRLEIEPTEPDADKKFIHWLKTFTNYADGLPAEASKLNLLINFIGHQAFAIIESIQDYNIGGN